MLGGYGNVNLGEFLWQLLKKGLWIKEKLFFELDKGEKENSGYAAWDRKWAQTMIASPCS